MSYTYRRKSTIYVRYESWDESGNHYEFGYPVDAGYLQSSRTETDRRRKPTDLFGNATQIDRYTSDVSVSPVTISTSYSRTTIPMTWFGTFSAGFVYEPPLLTAVDGRLRKKIKEQNVNLAQTMAEYRQTSKMFVSLASDVVKTFRSLRSGRFIGDFVRILKTPRSRAELNIANRWLQYQYGIKPLMSDIYGSAELLATRIRTGFPQYIKSSQSTDFHKRAYVVSSYDSSKKYVSIGNGKCTVRAAARYTISDAELKQLSQVGISNPLLLAWELIPYSFVIDWLIPVGDFLSSLDALNGTSNLTVVRSMKEEVTYTISYGGATAVQKNTHYYRTGNDSELQFPRLSYQPSNSLKAVANGLALLRQLRR